MDETASHDDEVHKDTDAVHQSLPSAMLQLKKQVQCRFVKSSLNRFVLYETRSRFYVIGSNQSEDTYRVLKIDRTTAPEERPHVIEDSAVYSRHQMVQLLSMIEDGNKTCGGLRKVLVAYGIIGFIRFLEGYYMILVTKRSPVSLICGHYIYHIEDTAFISIPHQITSHPNEARYVDTFSRLDLSSNFYFSYTYDLTNSMQRNMEYCQSSAVADAIKNKGRDANPPPRNTLNPMFTWNYFLLTNGFEDLNATQWALPIVHGFIDQSKISVFGQSIYVTLIARRSRHYAGARFLKRGINSHGHVANEVESEQIVHEAGVTSMSFARCSSFIQHRGSVPLFWCQESGNMAPKPRIMLNQRDPFYATTAKHFEDMFGRYGAPVFVLNLVKQKEKHKRESILLDEYTAAIEYLNQFLPSKRRIQMISWDMARAAKSNDQDVIGHLEDVAERMIQTIGFFDTGKDLPIKRRQVGVIRTNCVDCIDRTNAAQFVMGKCALAHQLHALGVISSPTLLFDSDAVNTLMEMYHDHGNIVALQYGGSFLVNTMETYQKRAHWTSQSRDMINTIRRYYNNSFTDAEKQDAMNLFLGYYVPEKMKYDLWELPNDFYLHNVIKTAIAPTGKYIQWYNPLIFEQYDEPAHADVEQAIKMIQKQPPSDIKEWFWTEYYRPRLFTSFSRHFAVNIISTLPPGKEIDLSPFTIRSDENSEHPVIGLDIDVGKKVLTVTRPAKSLTHDKSSSSKMAFLTPSAEQRRSKKSNVRPMPTGKTETLMEETVKASMHPTVKEAERREYHRYTKQFKEIPLPLLNLSSLGGPKMLGQLREYDVGHPDYDLYCHFVYRYHDRPFSAPHQRLSSQALSFTGHHQGKFRPSSKDGARSDQDHAIYKAHVDFPIRTALKPAVPSAPKQKVQFYQNYCKAFH